MFNTSEKNKPIEGKIKIFNHNLGELMPNIKYICHKGKSFKQVTENNIVTYFDLEGNPIELESIDEMSATPVDYTLVEDNSDAITFLSKLIKESVYLQNDEEYTILSSFALLSYTYDLFETIPYLWLNGTKGSGKTTTIKCLKNLVRNPVHASSFTGSALYRIIDSESPTLFLDEVEELSKRNTTTETIVKILNSGYDKSGTVLLTEKLKHTKFKTYSVKILAGITGLLDTIEDRCIKIRLTKAATSFNNKNTLNNNQTKILELLLAKIDRKIIELIDIINDPSQLKLSDIFINRSLDKWFPILSLTKVYGNDELFEFLKLYAEDEIKKSIEEEKNSKENIVKSLIEEFCKENAGKDVLELNGKYYFKTKTLLDYFEQYQPYKIFKTQSELTTYLKVLNIHTDRRRFNHIVTSFYTFSIEQFQNLKHINPLKKAS